MQLLTTLLTLEHEVYRVNSSHVPRKFLPIKQNLSKICDLKTWRSYNKATRCLLT